MSAPDPLREHVIRKIPAIFPHLDPAGVLAALDTYDGNEKSRVQLAVLKLSEEDGQADPSRYLDAARLDYRDVLAWAEYPGQIAAGPTTSLSVSDHSRLVKADRHQYQAWLAR